MRRTVANFSPSCARSLSQGSGIAALKVARRPGIAANRSFVRSADRSRPGGRPPFFPLLPRLRRYTIGGSARASDSVFFLRLVPSFSLCASSVPCPPCVGHARRSSVPCVYVGPYLRSSRFRVAGEPADARPSRVTCRERRARVLFVRGEPRKRQRRRRGGCDPPSNTVGETASQSSAPKTIDGTKVREGGRRIDRQADGEEERRSEECPRRRRRRRGGW